MMGNLVATTGPDARKFFTPAAGSRKNSWLVKSTRAAIVHASLVVIARESGHPVCISAELRNLIGAMSRANHLWGAPHIHGELLKLGLTIAQSTVARYMYRGWPPSQAGGPF